MTINEYLNELAAVNEVLKGLPGDPNVLSVHINYNSSYIQLYGSCGLMADYRMPSRFESGRKDACKKIINGIEVFWYEQVENDGNSDI